MAINKSKPKFKRKKPEGELDKDLYDKFTEATISDSSRNHAKTSGSSNSSKSPKAGSLSSASSATTNSSA